MALAACGLHQVAAKQATPTATKAREPFRLLVAHDTAKKLHTHDLFLRSMTALDRQLRMKRASGVDEATFVSFAKRQARDFDETQKQRTMVALNACFRRIDELGIGPLFPIPVSVAQTTGDEEGAYGFDLTYTRAGTIYVNAKALARADLAHALAHELFHVLTFANEALRDELYGLLGFRRVDRITLTPSLDAVRLTSPEAPTTLHALTLSNGGAEPVEVAFVWSSNAKYRGGGLNEYATPTWALLNEHHEGQALVTVRDLPGLEKKLHRNTGYLAGPEEILADNFALLLMNETDLEDRALIEEMRTLLARFAQREK